MKMDSVKLNNNFYFQVPTILANGTIEIIDPMYDSFIDLEQRVLKIYNEKKRSKRATGEDSFQGRRYIIYDRPPEKKEKKKKKKCPFKNGIAALTFMNFAIAALYIYIGIQTFLPQLARIPRNYEGIPRNSCLFLTFTNILVLQVLNLRNPYCLV